MLQESLRKTHLFAPLCPDELDMLTAGAAPVHLTYNSHLFHIGEQLDAYYWVASGRLRLYRMTHEGEEKVFHLLGEGDLVAETIMFAPQCRSPLSAVAITECLLFRLAREHLLALVDQSPPFARHLLEEMSARLYQAVNRIDQLTVNNASQRLVLYLIELYQQQQNLSLKLPVNCRTLARQLSVTPETISRLLKFFRREELICVKGDTWVLHDLDRLCAVVHLPLPAHTDTGNHADMQGNLFRCCNFR